MTAAADFLMVLKRGRGQADAIIFMGIKKGLALQFAEAMNDITGLAVKPTHPVFLTFWGFGK